jgi:hypothetical protein
MCTCVCLQLVSVDRLTEAFAWYQQHNHLFDQIEFNAGRLEADAPLSGLQLHADGSTASEDSVQCDDEYRMMADTEVIPPLSEIAEAEDYNRYHLSLPIESAQSVWQLVRDTVCDAAQSLADW